MRILPLADPSRELVTAVLLLAGLTLALAISGRSDGGPGSPGRLRTGI